MSSKGQLKRKVDNKRSDSSFENKRTLGRIWAGRRRRFVFKDKCSWKYKIIVER